MPASPECRRAGWQFIDQVKLYQEPPDLLKYLSDGDLASIALVLGVGRPEDESGPVHDLVTELLPCVGVRLIRLHRQPPHRRIWLLHQAATDFIEDLILAWSSGDVAEEINKVICVVGGENVAAIPGHASIVGLLKPVIDAYHERAQERVEIRSR